MEAHWLTYRSKRVTWVSFEENLKTSRPSSHLHSKQATPPISTAPEGGAVPVEGGALRPIRFLRFLGRHDEDSVLAAVRLVQINQPHLLRLLHVHLLSERTPIKTLASC